MTTITVQEHPVAPITEADAMAFLESNGSDRLKAMKVDSIVAPIELARALGVKPQMIFQYIRSGKIEHRLSETKTKLIPWDVAVAFVQARLQKEADKQAQIDDQLEG
jgi:hypothetical protein